jgi:hypothetical protein
MKKVEIELSGTEELTRVSRFVLEIPDDMSDEELLSLDGDYYEQIANECALDWEIEDAYWIGVDERGIGITPAPETVPPHARLVRRGDGQVAWEALDTLQAERALAYKIRRTARAQNLIPQKSRKDGLWYFADEANRLLSPEDGLASPQALEWLRQPG